MNELGKQIVDLLRNAYLGATVYQDSDTMIRISRAVAAFEADPQLDPQLEITKVFTEDMIRSIRTESESPDKLLPDPIPTLTDGGQRFVYEKKLVSPITKDRVQSLPDSIEGDIHEQ